MKFECIFAMNHAKDSNTAKAQEGILYTLDSVVNANIRPSVFLHKPLASNVAGCSLAGFRKPTVSFIFIHISNFICAMPRNNEICVGAKQSTTSTRRNGAKSISRVSNPDADQSIADVLTELTEAFNAEMDAKNKAYLFILSNGLLDSFADFCRDYHSCDPHKDCVEYLLSKC